MFFDGLGWEEGRKKWRTLSREYHPDLAADDADREARTRKFQKLSAEWHVWEWLNDPRTAEERRQFPTRLLRKQMEYQKMCADEYEEQQRENPSTARGPHHQYDFNNRQSDTWQHYYEAFYRGSYGFSGFWNAGYARADDANARWEYTPPPDDWQPTEEEIDEAKHKFDGLEWEYTGRATPGQRRRSRPLQFVYDAKTRRLWIHGSTYQIKDELKRRGAEWDDDHYCNYYQFHYQWRENGST